VWCRTAACNTFCACMNGCPELPCCYQIGDGGCFCEC
jgi:hypothetical protein